MKKKNSTLTRFRTAPALFLILGMIAVSAGAHATGIVSFAGLRSIITGGSFTWREQDFNNRMHDVAQEQMLESEYYESFSRVLDAESRGDLQSVLNSLEDVERRWGKVGGKFYGLFFRRTLGGPMMGIKLPAPNNRLEKIRETFARKALEKADTFDYSVEWNLLGFLPSKEMKDHADSHRQERLSNLKLWIHLIKRIQVERDSNFNSMDLPSLSVAPPPVGNQPSVPGISPNDIKDVKIKKAYEEAIRENNEKAEKFNFQYRLAEDSKIIKSDFIRFVALNFSQSRAEFEGVLGELSQARIAADLLERMRQELSQKNMSRK